jgi:hypothetical protein
MGQIKPAEQAAEQAIYESSQIENPGERSVTRGGTTYTMNTVAKWRAELTGEFPSQRSAGAAILHNMQDRASEEEGGSEERTVTRGGTTYTRHDLHHEHRRHRPDC